MPIFNQGSCALCKGMKLRTFGGLDPTGAKLKPPTGSRIVSCATCGLVSVDPMPHWTDADFATLYAEGYFEPMAPWWQEVREQRDPARRAAEALRHLRTSERSMLEVGAGVYGFGARYLAARGWQATAQEPSVAFHEQLRQRDSRIRVTATPFLELPADERHSLIYADSVFEHVPNPLDYFTKARDLLVPGGVVYFVSPNEHSLVNWMLTARNLATNRTARMLCPYRDAAHLVGYTRRAIEWIGERLDLEVVHFSRRWDWCWRHELDKHPGPVGYVRAALRYAMDRAGVGTSLEAALRRPA